MSSNEVTRLQVEVAELRNELTSSRAKYDLYRESAERTIAMVRAAHDVNEAIRQRLEIDLESATAEAFTKGLALKACVSRREAAEERVAELERELSEQRLMSKGVIEPLVTALSSARTFAEHALTYLTDEEDVESTPLHAIGHARTELRDLLAAIPEAATPALEPLSLVEDRTPEQLAADGDYPCKLGGQCYCVPLCGTPDWPHP